MNIIYCQTEYNTPLTNFNIFMNSMVPGVVLAFILVLSIIDFISKKFLYTIILNFFLIFFVIDSEFFLNRRHKQFFQQLFIVGAVFSFFFYTLTLCSVILVQKYGKKLFFLEILLILLSLASFYKFKVQNSCEYWH